MSLATPILGRRPANGLLVTRHLVRIAGQRRLESTAAEKAKSAASSATSTASATASRAVRALSAVTSSAGPALGRAAQGAVGALGKIGGRTGRFIGFVERQVPWVIYYSRVGLELSRLVFQGQKMAPPPVATFQAYYRRLLSSVRNPSGLVTASASAVPSSPQQALQSIRNLSRAQVASAAVIAAECLGFFTVGEIIGRRKIIGYHGEPQSAHH